MSYTVAVSNTNAPIPSLIDYSEGVKDKHCTEIISPCEDTFVLQENESHCEESSNISWLGSIRRFFGRVLSKARRWWRQIREYNPFTQLFDLVENLWCSSSIERARNRNGARTQEELRRYHESLLFDGKDENKLFRESYTKNSQEGTLVILCLGNEQTHLTPREQAGLNELYDRLSSQGYEVMCFRSGLATCDLKDRFLFGNCELNTNVLFNHTSNLIEDRIYSSGMFQGRSTPRNVVLVGYSFGGGTVQRLLNERWESIGGGVPVSSICIDPIELGAYHLGVPVEERPLHSRRHFVFYQQNSWAINGSHINGIYPQGDRCTEMVNDDHGSIDNNLRIHDFIIRYIRRISQQTRNTPSSTLARAA